jgi:hypothetical protein
MPGTTAHGPVGATVQYLPAKNTCVRAVSCPTTTDLGSSRPPEVG